MLLNYFTIAMRNLLKHRFYALINIVGLGIGVSCVILIGLYVQNELRYDLAHEKGDRIYRVLRGVKTENGQTVFEASISGAVAPTVINDFPAVETAIRVMPSPVWVHCNGQSMRANFCMTDRDFFDVFTFPIVRGDKTSLLQPQSVMLTESAAQRYFGAMDPIGKTLKVEAADLNGVYTVSGIIRDLPQNVTQKFDMISASVSARFSAKAWDVWIPRAKTRPTEVYVLLREKASVASVAPKLKDMIERHLPPEVAVGLDYHLQPLRDIYLYSRADYGLSQSAGLVIVNGDIAHVYAASITAFFILLIACINFTNLTTARAANRAREVGLRKVVGAYRLQLAVQFLCESIILAGLSLLVGLGIVEILLPIFNHYVGLQLSLYVSFSFVLGLVGLVLLVGFLAGSYPALFLSRFRPVDVLKGTLTMGAKSGILRKTLVVFQFAISVVLIVVTLVIFEQMDFVRQKNLGFDAAQIVETRLLWEYRFARPMTHGTLWLKHDVVKEAFLEHPNILAATISRFPHGRDTPHTIFRAFVGGDDEWRMRLNEVDETFIDVFDIPLVAGRNFSKERAFSLNLSAERQVRGLGTAIADNWQDEYILNEAAVQVLGWKDPIGRRFGIKERVPGRVVGVVKNFHTRSLRESIEPMVLFASNMAAKNIFLKVKPEDMQGTIAHMEKVWKRFLPSRPFAFTFMNDNLDRLYAADQQLGRAMGVFATLAIFVACLGLFGLVAFLAEQRKKEVSVRKVFGASSGHVVGLFMKESTVLVLVACVLAWPIAYWAVQKWLQDFAYRIELSAMPFLIGGGCMVVLTLMTMAYQVIKTVQTNPVDALRQE